MCSLEIVVLLKRLIFLSMGCESLMMLLKKLKHQIAQVIVDLDPLMLSPSELAKSFSKVRRSNFEQALQKQGLGAGAKSFPRPESPMGP